MGIYGYIHGITWVYMGMESYSLARGRGMVWSVVVDLGRCRRCRPSLGSSSPRC